jgi:hypothetical protein
MVRELLCAVQAKSGASFGTGAEAQTRIVMSSLCATNRHLAVSFSLTKHERLLEWAGADA